MEEREKRDSKRSREIQKSRVAERGRKEEGGEPLRCTGRLTVSKAEEQQGEKGSQTGPRVFTAAHLIS